MSITEFKCAKSENPIICAFVEAFNGEFLLKIKLVFYGWVILFIYFLSDILFVRNRFIVLFISILLLDLTLQSHILGIRP